MGQESADRGVPALIEAIAGRGAHESERLAATMLGRCWPGGMGDRSEVAALEWVRRWGPRSAGVMPPACRCAAQSCTICN